MDNISDLEQDFYKDTTENGRFILSLGCKSSGKTNTLIGYLAKVLYHNVFESIHAVLPAYHHEQNNSYAFLKNQKHVNIYSHYNEKISKAVDKDREKKKTLFIIDDATNELMKIDPTFTRLITTSRHGLGVTIWSCVHSCRKILSPVVRQNIEHLFIYRIVNAKLLYDLYDEYYSMTFPSFSEFKRFYTIATNEKYSAIYYSLMKGQIDTDVKNWDINVHQDIYKSRLKPTQSTQKPVVKKPSQNDNVRKIGGIKIGKFFIR